MRSGSGIEEIEQVGVGRRSGRGERCRCPRGWSGLKVVKVVCTEG
jgi:hypothetical protein